MQEAYSIASVLTVIAALFFGGLIFIRGRGGRVAKSYFYLMSAVALWAAGLFNTATSVTAANAFMWMKFLFVSASFVPAFYFRFIVRLMSLEKKYKSLVWLGYFLSFAFAASIMSKLVLRGVIFKYSAFWPEPGKFLPINIFYFLAFPMLAHIIALKNKMVLTYLAEKQLKLISIAAILGFGGGLSTLLPAYGIFAPRLESIAVFLIPFSCAFIALATYTARLMDIELLRRRAFIFSLLYSSIVGVFVSLVFVVQNFLLQKYEINKFIFPVIALFVITIFIRPAEQVLIRITDKFLFQRKYNYRKMLEQASKGMLFVTKKEKLIKLIARVLAKQMRVTIAAVYLHDKDSGAYKCMDSRSYRKQEAQKEIKAESAFVEWLKEKKSPLLRDDIINWLQKETLFPHKVVLKRTLEQLRVTMHMLNATICIPAFMRTDLIGFLILGDKLSGDSYAKDDVALLSTLANSAAIAIENSQMYDELTTRIQKIIELYKEQHELFIDTATAFSYAVDLRDAYSRQHTQRIIGYCTVVIKGLDKMNAGYSKEQDFFESLKIAALLHDVGKVSVPDAILNKEGALAPEERKIVENHINVAVNILKPIEELSHVINIVKYHHEYYDGHGYPEGRKGDDIPFASRILSVANAYDAMTSDRPYRKALTHQKAAERLKAGAGKDFDPLIVRAILVGFEGVGSTREGEGRTTKGEMPPVLY